MSMYSGIFNIESIFFGDIELGSCYLGDTLVWEKNVSEVNYIFRNIDANGNLTLATGTLPNADEIIKVGNYGLAYAFYNCTGLTGTLNLSNLTTVGDHGLYRAFYKCSNLTGTLNLSNLTTIGDYGLHQAFYNCSKLSGTLNLSNLTTVGDSGLHSAFVGLKNISSKINLTNLTNIGDKGLYQAFYQCTNITDIYFNSLTTTSFGSYTNQFQNMMHSTGTSKTHRLHFPSNLETTIQNLTGYPTFGGSSGYVVCAFDLPATS